MFIEIASSHLTHPDWLTHYYPSDLPEEWRLSYYANEFPSVLIPASTWTKDKALVSTVCLEDVHAGFSFSFELTTSLLASSQWPSIEHRLLACAPQAEAILLANDLTAAELPETVGRAYKHYREQTCLQIDGMDLSLWLSEGRQPQHAERESIACIKIQQATPLALRHLLEKLIAFGEKQQKNTLLYIDAPWSVISNLRLMKPLFGLH